MATEIKAPTFPESIQDGTIATWHKKAGDSVSRDELLVDIETDKVVLEVVSPTDGTLTEVRREEGATIVSNEVIAIVEAGAAKAASTSSSDANKQTNETTAAAQGDIPVSPAARKLLQERGLEAAAIRGSGKGGLITKEDVRLDAAKHRRLTEVLEAHVRVQTIYEYKERLKAVWTQQAKGQQELLAASRAWGQ